VNDFSLPSGLSASSPQKRNLGAFYTPHDLALYMISLLNGLSESSRVFEPALGNAAFVRPLLNRSLVQSSQIYALDLDPPVLPLARELGIKFALQDALTLPLPFQSGFSHTISNPPFLNKASLYMKTNRKVLARLFPHFGVNETYVLFTLLALKHLQPKGQMVFLLSDTFLTLGLHAPFRRFLLENTTINSVTLLSPSTFAPAKVNTCVVSLRKTAPCSSHTTVFVDARRSPSPSQGSVHTVLQRDLLDLPACEFQFGSALKLLHRGRKFPPLTSLLNGGLGMHTSNNKRFLKNIDHSTSAPSKTSSKTLHVSKVSPAPVWFTSSNSSKHDSSAPSWVFYYKKGGFKPWFAPVDSALDFSSSARMFYTVPSSMKHRANSKQAFNPGFLVSGVSSQLSARSMYPGALWDSNKVFAFFPKDSEKFPPHFFIALLNSSFYRSYAKALNHTSSLQVRDLRRLPLLPLSSIQRASLANLGSRAVLLSSENKSTFALEKQLNRLVQTTAIQNGFPDLETTHT